MGIVSGMRTARPNTCPRLFNVFLIVIFDGNYIVGQSRKDRGSGKWVRPLFPKCLLSPVSGGLGETSGGAVPTLQTALVPKNGEYLPWIFENYFISVRLTNSVFFHSIDLGA